MHVNNPCRPNITVHNFSLKEPSSETSISQSRAQAWTPSPERCMEEARGLVEACATNSADGLWRGVRAKDLELKISGNLFKFCKDPPPAVEFKHAKVVLKEWGSPVTPDEIWSLRDLEEFVHLERFVAFGTKKRPVTEENAAPPKRLRPYEASFHDLVPQPHVHVTVTGLPCPPVPSSLKEYARCPPIYLLPHAPPFKWDRRAWLIPLRGELPWENATPAYLQDPMVRPRPPKMNSNDPVCWTPSAICAFWEFLMRLRVARTVGAIGIALHVADSASTPRPIPSQNESSSEPSALPRSARLAAVDYIKVHHEATLSLYVRNAIDVWRYTLQAKEDSKMDKIRLLKGAKLVLLDNKSRGVMIL